MAPTVRVHVETLAIDEGLWCRICRLPSGARIWFVVTSGARMVLRTKAECRDCHGVDVTD